MEPFDISLIIPFLNESNSIENLFSEINNYSSTLRNIKLEVLFVDDGSTDNTVQLLKQTTHAYYSARIIQLSKNYGSHAAIRAGMLHAKGKFITFFPADLQYSMDLITELHNKCLEGYDIVRAEREEFNVAFIEKYFSKIYSSFMRKFAVSNYPEKGFDVVMFNQKVRDELNQNIEGNSSVFLQILSLGFRQTAIPCARRRRKTGTSKWTLPKKIKLFIDSFVAFSYTPIRFVSILGLSLSIVGFVWVLYIMYRALFLKDLAQGWPALVSILMIGFGVTNISLGIIAEYLWRTFDTARKRKVFIIDKIIDLNNEH